MFDEEEGDIFRDPLIDRDDVYYRAAILTSNIEEWHKHNPEFRGEKDEIPHIMRLSPEEAEQQIPLELVMLERELETFLEIVAAHPKYKDLVVSWMVEIEGDDGLTEERMNIKHEENKVIDEEFHYVLDEAFKSIGGLYQAVESYLQRENYTICEKVAGKDGWTLGMICNDAAASDLCADVHKKFKKAIGRGMLRVRKSFWGYRLVGLSAENYKDFLDLEEFSSEGEYEPPKKYPAAPEYLEGDENDADDDYLTFEDF